ncbi:MULTISPECIES: MFS transporter [unclassified Marinitoga]|uniref:MFS transporter n=1 Tax=unclassified Marinitoga TaxID=2640159 RepID=UPI00064126D4|nr:MULTISPECIES: MFS transporter [unclassified Marinitoga]KLO24899.1 MFS transporter [Marinitoga sp. 1155]NUU98998.1 MFS transporter [Marinitoga sp. 1154]
MYNKNVIIYPFYRFFINFRIIGPIVVPYMIFKGLNYSEIMLLQSIYSISIFLFEVPTGSLADKVSRKLSLFLSGVFAALGLTLYIVFNSFWVFALAEILFGIGLTLSSGADSALLYESLIKLNRKNDFQVIEGKSNSYLFLGHAFGSIISGFLYSYNKFLPFWISVLSVIIGSFIAFLFVETEREKSEHSYTIHVFKSFKLAINTPRILWALVYAMFIGFTFRIGFWLYQPYFSIVNIDVKWYGVIFFAFNIIAAWASKFLSMKIKDIRPRKVLLTLLGITTLSFILPVIFISKLAIAFLTLQQIVRSLYRPTMNFYINHQVEDKYRATVISMVSLAANLSFAILSPFIGMALDYKGTIFTYILVGIISLTGTIELILLRKKQKKLKEKMNASA